jgi:hypothetical protein
MDKYARELAEKKKRKERAEKLKLVDIRAI